MTLNEMIYQRKSCRSFTGTTVDAQMIEKILSIELNLCTRTSKFVWISSAATRSNASAPGQLHS